MKVARAAGVDDAATDLLVIALTAGQALPRAFASMDRALDGALSKPADFTGRFAEVETVRPMGRSPIERVALVGLGDASRLDLVRLRNALEIALRPIARKVRMLTLAWPGTRSSAVVAGDLAVAAVGAAVRLNWSEGTHKSGRRQAVEIKTLTLAGFPDLDDSRLQAALVLGESANLARELVNRPASELTPEAFAVEARAQAKRHGLECDVLGEGDLKRLRYGAILAVASGSARPPRLVVLRHRARRAGGDRLALVGKGITFDSGGISIKPAADMQYMKGDMGGAAAVLGAMVAIARLKVDLDVTGVLCCAENMVSSTSMRPGDVVTSGAGKTIEVVNTDAEGRMVLADGVHHAVKLGATHVVDIATLTGGQRIALGPVAAMIQGSDPDLTGRVIAAAAGAGERVWELPTFAEYETQLESSIADLNNSPGRDGNAITAGLFIREFAGGRPWVHIDMAAPSWNRVAAVRQVPRGPAGFGVGTLALLATLMAKARQKAATRAKSDKTSRK